MSDRVLFLAPRLDVPFKNLGPIPETSANYNNLPFLRKKWLEFYALMTERLIDWHCDGEDGRVHTLSLPLWMYTPQLVEQYNPDLVFIPHRNREQFEVDRPAMYYMQTVFPHIFSVNSEGWMTHSNDYPYDISVADNDGGATFEYFRQRLDNNISKFTQPDTKTTVLTSSRPSIFIPMQIPHDQSIAYNSVVTMEEAALATVMWAKKNYIDVIVKPHPANTGSCAEIVSLMMKTYDGVIYTSDSIHNIIPQVDAVYTVNSGVGFEAMLHKKPVVTFGDAEYDSVTTKIGTGFDFDQAWEFVTNFGEADIKNYEMFYHVWYGKHVDVDKPYVPNSALGSMH